MKVVALLSGGIDSPVAAYLMSKAGADVILLHMDNRPYADDGMIEHVDKLADRLRVVTGKEMPLYIAPHNLSQTAIKEGCDYNYQCVMCKRLMQKSATEFAKNIGAGAIVMGDSLGQVASQTLKNIRSENFGLDIPVLRPLIGFDKLEIEAIAKEIGTFGISIEKVCGCTLVPTCPITEAKPDKIREFDETLNSPELAKKIATMTRIHL